MEAPGREAKNLKRKTLGMNIMSQSIVSGHAGSIFNTNLLAPKLILFLKFCKDENWNYRIGGCGAGIGKGISYCSASSHDRKQELLVLAVAGHAAVEALEAAGLKSLEGKIIIDVTNPLSHEPPVNGVLKLSTASNTSLMEQLQLLVPKAKFVKAFNTVGNTQMYKPSYKEGRPSMFICGNDVAAKKQVTKILDAFGWETEDMGSVEAARAIEPLCVLWCIPGFLRNQWTHAFKLLK